MIHSSILELCTPTAISNQKVTWRCTNAARSSAWGLFGFQFYVLLQSLFPYSYWHEDREECAMRCLNGANKISHHCCFDACFLEKTGLIQKGVLNDTAMLLATTEGGNVDEEYLKVVRNSIKKCKLEKFKNDEPRCDIPNWIYGFVTCVLKLNYMFCPNLKGKCLIYKEPILKCVPKVETTTTQWVRTTTTAFRITSKRTTKTKRLTTPKRKTTKKMTNSTKMPNSTKAKNSTKTSRRKTTSSS